MTKISESKTLTGNPTLVNSGFEDPVYNPLQLLQEWLTQAEQLNVSEPYGLVLSTVDTTGHPSSRVVLLKTIDDMGIVFASSATSKKGIDISHQSAVAGTLWWRETMQQVNFIGYATRLSATKSDAIWMKRTRDAQAVAAISHQSAAIVNEESMRCAVTKLIDSDMNIVRPETWHAYHVAIHEIEFWHGSEDRFHHRLRYKVGNDVWNYQRLQP